MKDTAFDIISLNENAVLVEGKLYKKNEVVKTIRTDIEGIASTSADLLPYGKFRIVESEAPNGYLTDGAKPVSYTHLCYILSYGNKRQLSKGTVSGAAYEST